MPADPGGAVARSLRRAAGLPDPDAPADGRLLLRFRRAGDEDAFAELVRRHGPMVLGVCRRVAGNHTDADDAFQAAFLVLVRRAAELTGRATVGDFLYGVAVRTALKARATAVKRRLKEARAAKPEAAPPPADESDRAAALDRELARLPEKYRAALVLCELEGRPRKDVAALLGIPQGTLSSRLAAGRKLLAGRLRRCGLALPAGGLAAPVAGVVPSKLLEATVRAATGAADGGVSELATEVTRAMLLTKLRAGLLVVPTVLVLGAAL
ncbi:MAG: sigma-70 family RNA polymerase sigma factor, partial [Gemmataceae bacterium]|nr:sigma-70 family RNA polymerase sigma factor [Gemmataceae bacterium]